MGKNACRSLCTMTLKSFPIGKKIKDIQQMFIIFSSTKFQGSPSRGLPNYFVRTDGLIQFNRRSAGLKHISCPIQFPVNFTSLEIAKKNK
jgi:hypothetical protein